MSLSRVDPIQEQNSELLKSRGLSVAFLAVHNRLTGGAKIFFEHANQMYLRGVPVVILSRDDRPDWMVVQAPWVKLPKALKLSALNGLFDIAVTMFWTGIPEILSLDAKLRVLLEQGDPSLFERGFLPENQGKVMELCYKAPVEIITVSHRLSSVLKERFGRTSIPISNAIDHNVFRPVCKKERGSFTVILVGADAAHFKGIRDGLSAVEILRRRGFSIEVIQVSPGGPTVYRTKRRVVYRPSLQLLASLYQEADAYLGCSWYESFSLPPLESMACGTPVVSTDNGGIREYGVAEENCLLAPIKDPESLARQLERVMKDKILYDRLVTRGIETAQGFTWERAREDFAGALLRFGRSKLTGGTGSSMRKIESFHRIAGDFLQIGDLKGTVAAEEVQAAKEFLRAALMLDPQNTDSLYNLAYVYVALNEDKKARELIERILEIEPSHGLALELKDFCEKKKGKVGEG